jgi:hypothetical protein
MNEFRSVKQRGRSLETSNFTLQSPAGHEDCGSCGAATFAVSTPARIALCNGGDDTRFAFIPWEICRCKVIYLRSLLLPTSINPLAKVFKEA